MTPDDFMKKWGRNGAFSAPLNHEMRNDLQRVVSAAVSAEREACVTAINRAAFDADLTRLNSKHAGYARGIRDAIGVIRARDVRDTPENTFSRA